jgi:hypothetical protein
MTFVSSSEIVEARRIEFLLELTTVPTERRLIEARPCSTSVEAKVLSECFRTWDVS